MTTTTTEIHTPPAPSGSPPARRGARIPLVVAGVVTAVLALGSVIGGGVSLWADSTKDEHGFISTSDHRFKSSGSALVTENIDLDGAEWLVDGDQFGKVRLQADQSGAEPVFVGVGPTEKVERYLRDVPHSVVTDIEYDPFEASYDDQGGDRRATPPGNERFWAATAEGVGTQDLTWEVEDGEWSIVVMNADGSPGVDADVTAGAKLPWLDELGWGLLGGGVLLYGVATALIIVGFRPRRDRSGGGIAPAPVATPAA